MRSVIFWSLFLPLTFWQQHVAAQPTAEQRKDLNDSLASLRKRIDELAAGSENQSFQTRSRRADVAVFAKAVEWQLRHNEFPKKDYVRQAFAALKTGTERAEEVGSWRSLVGAQSRSHDSRLHFKN